jgi:hypothetical protein
MADRSDGTSGPTEFHFSEVQCNHPILVDGSKASASRGENTPTP